MARNRNDENTNTENGDAPEMSAEEVAKNAAKEAKREERKSAQVVVREFIKTVEDAALKTALVLLVGSGNRARRSPVSTINTVLRDALIAAGDEGISEMDVFKQFKIGRPEMTSKTRIFLKSAKPEDRIWVTFFDEDETYRIVATGADAPEGWDGFVPADENLL